jgi:hypothetical protein
MARNAAERIVRHLEHSRFVAEFSHSLGRSGPIARPAGS